MLIPMVSVPVTYGTYVKKSSDLSIEQELLAVLMSDFFAVVRTH